MTVRLIAALLVLGTAAAACGDGNQVRGIVLEVEGDLTTVESFVLRLDGGETITVVPDPDGDHSFPLPHLNDHRASLSPVLVTLDRSVDPPVATAIRDADTADWHE